MSTAESARNRREEFLRRLEQQQQQQQQEQEQEQGKKGEEDKAMDINDKDDEPGEKENEELQQQLQAKEDEDVQVMEYLTKCGLVSSDYSIDDVDESSRMFLRQLSSSNEKKKFFDDGNDADTSNDRDEGNRSISNDVKDATASTDIAESVEHLGNKTKAEHKDEGDHHLEAEIETLSELKTDSIKHGGSDEKNGSDTATTAPKAAGHEIEKRDDETQPESLQSRIDNLYNFLYQSTIDDLNEAQNLIKTFKVQTDNESQFDLKPAASSSASASKTSNDCNDGNKTRSYEERINDLNLEPWQKELFEKLEEQQQSILKCQTQIDALATLTTALVKAQFENQVQDLKQFHHFREFPNFPSMDRPQPDLNQTLPPMQHQHQNQHNQPRPNLIILHKLQEIFQSLLSVPRNIMSYINSTRPMRLVFLLQREAANHVPPNNDRNARFLDWNLLMKMLLVCVFFSNRMNDKRGSGNNSNNNDSNNEKDDDMEDVIIELWKAHRVTLFVACSVLMYFLKTGLVQFLYRVLIKEDGLGRVWRNDDILDGNVNDGDGDGEGGAGNNVDEGADNGIVRRRGRRDRAIPRVNEVGRLDEGLAQNLRVRGPPNPAAAAAPPRQGRGFVAGLAERVENTFLGGAIYPRRDLNNNGNRNNQVGGNNNVVDQLQQQDNQQLRAMDLFLDFIWDIKYLFGSFFLSLLPIWRPRLERLDREEHDLDGDQDGLNNREQNGNENVDGVDGVDEN